MLTFFIKRPRFAMVIALVITLLGAIALRIIPVEQYPQIAPPVGTSLPAGPVPAPLTWRRPSPRRWRRS